MGQLLSHPLTEKTIQYNVQSAKFNNCVGSMQGYRLTQEDSHLILNGTKIRFHNPFRDTVQELDVSIFAVFDGHGTDECSKFLSGVSHKDHHHRHHHTNNDTSGTATVKGLSRWIIHCLENHRYGAVDRTSSQKTFKKMFRTENGLISQCIKDAFFKQDEELHKYFASSACGSTAIVAIIVNNRTLFVANCGDSRCIVASKQNGIKTMSFDHKPQHIGELIRINDNGGSVSLGRVGGVLALSRAFGDFQFKRGVTYNASHPTKSNTPAQESQVTVEPDILVHTLDYNRDEFVVLACDGIWDIYNNKQCIQFIKHHLSMGTKMNVIMTKLLDHGIGQANSDTGVGFDNMTAIVIALNKPNESLDNWYLRMKARLEKERGVL